MRWMLRWLAWWWFGRWVSGSGPIQALLQENLALRQQVAVLERSVKRPKIRARDRWFWLLLSRHWGDWRSACRLVKPSTVVQWYRAGFRMFWRWKSRVRSPGRPSMAPAVRTWIRRMATENPTWGAPRIHGELTRLGVRVSERTVARLMPRKPRSPQREQTWRTFLSNHSEVLAAMDFLVVPTWNFGLLYVLVIVEHGRRIVRHVNVTAHPTASWVVQQLREAFPGGETPRYLLFDRDSIFGAAKTQIAALGMIPKQISFRSPWQNGVCERFLGTLRRELLDHVVVLNEAHLLRVVRGFLAYYHEDRTHLALQKDCPRPRGPDVQPGRNADLQSEARCGGLHRRYRWSDAA